MFHLGLEHNSKGFYYTHIIDRHFRTAMIHYGDDETAKLEYGLQFLLPLIHQKDWHLKEVLVLALQIPVTQ